MATGLKASRKNKAARPIAKVAPVRAPRKRFASGQAKSGLSETTQKTKAVAKPRPKTRTDIRTKTNTVARVADRVLYLYAITRPSPKSPPSIIAEAVDGIAAIEPLASENYVCWISRVSRQEFADELTERMQDLEWLASAGLRHQRVVAEISRLSAALPARFGTVFLSSESMDEHVRRRQQALRDAFARVADTDEWGVKIFAIAPPKRPVSVRAKTGADYLKRKAETLRPQASKTLDKDVREFVQKLTDLSVDTSPGGKASAGQPGLLWHGSFLIRRKDRKKLETVLKKYAARWHETRRVDCSGPWPPYSFVGDHAG